MTVKSFFKQYPNAPKVVKVGTDLYLAHRIGAARDHARRHGLEVEVHENPAFAEATEEPTAVEEKKSAETPKASEAKSSAEAAKKSTKK